MTQDERVEKIREMNKKLHELREEMSKVSRPRQEIVKGCDHTYKGKSILEPLSATSYMTCPACNLVITW